MPKRATFAASVLSPPHSSAMTSLKASMSSMRENSGERDERSRNASGGPWTPVSARMNGSTGSGQYPIIPTIVCICLLGRHTNVVN